jgi:hypothetical protein
MFRVLTIVSFIVLFGIMFAQGCLAAELMP